MTMQQRAADSCTPTSDSSTAATLVILFVASRDMAATQPPLPPAETPSNEASRFVWLSGDWNKTRNGRIFMRFHPFDGSQKQRLCLNHGGRRRLFQVATCAEREKERKKIPKITKLSSNISLLLLLLISALTRSPSNDDAGRLRHFSPALWAFPSRCRVTSESCSEKMNYACFFFHSLSFVKWCLSECKTLFHLKTKQ